MMVVLIRLIQTTIKSFQKVVYQMAQIRQALAIPQVEIVETPHVKNNNFDQQGNVNLEFKTM